jgi:hypothetical protein
MSREVATADASETVTTVATQKPQSDSNAGANITVDVKTLANHYSVLPALYHPGMLTTDTGSTSHHSLRSEASMHTTSPTILATTS